MVRVTGRIDPLPPQFAHDNLTLWLHPAGAGPDRDTYLRLESGRDFEFREVPEGDYLLKLTGSHFETNPESGVTAGSRRLVARLDLFVGRNDIHDLRIRALEPVSIAGRIYVDGASSAMTKHLQVTLQPVPLDGDFLGAPPKKPRYATMEPSASPPVTPSNTPSMWTNMTTLT